MSNNVLKTTLLCIVFGLSTSTVLADASHDKLAAECKTKAYADSSSAAMAEFCLAAEATIEKESPNSAAHVFVLTQLGLTSGYNNGLKKSQRAFYEKLLRVAEAGFGKTSDQMIEPLANLAAMEKDWKLSRQYGFAALEISDKLYGALSERSSSIITILVGSYSLEKKASPSTYKIDDAVLMQQKKADNSSARLGLKDYETGVEWLELGKLTRDKKDKKEARRLTEKALQIFIDGRGGNWIGIAKRQLLTIENTPDE